VSPLILNNAVDNHAGSEPVGISKYQPDGGVRVLLVKLNEPPVGVEGCVADRLKINPSKTDLPVVPSSPSIPSLPFWKASSGVPQVILESVPDCPTTEAIPILIYTGLVPEGTLADHPVGATSDCVPNVKLPPEGVLGVLVAL
jgi:hypothetical protein